MNTERMNAEIAVAISHYKAGRFERALEVVDQLLAQAPQVALSWRFKGETLFELQRYRSAAGCFDKATELGGPGTEDSQLWKAMSEANDGRPDDALKTAKRFIATVKAGSPLHDGARKLIARLEAKGDEGGY